MNHTAPVEDVGRVWDRYVQVARNYEHACQVTNAAQSAHQLAHDSGSPCESVYAVVEAAYANEAMWGRALVTASEAFQAASDAAFLSTVGISIR